uniref:Uncharacterized protein n=1 Tax=Panagrolaimus sp. ES5 TaxID=591445 RepID=A0AC34F267_9BILA
MDNLKPVFGQEFRSAYGYDEEKFSLISGLAASNSRPTLVPRNLETSAAIMSDHDDFVNLVKALQITEMQLLDMQMQGSKSIRNIIEFVENNVRGKTMILNICVVTHEVRVKSPRIVNTGKKLSKLLVGHHILVCIPVDDSADDYNLTNIKNFASMPADVLQLFRKEAPALINYKRVEEKSVTELIQESQNFSPDEIVSLFAKIDDATSVAVASAKSFIPLALVVAGVSIVGYFIYKKYHQSK